MIDTLKYIVAEIPLGTSYMFLGMYIITGIIFISMILRGVFKDY